ncbi:protein of unknown function (DUF1905) [Mariprofundus ferrinatatus]|uniref:DUF1905 domain-containing protein n=1 Tax=Mariprofundus ferrinatatus TaxID=1921087 RepID=A0A2K8L1E1_9PROT|nr:DUF1905 domain-containing protein [Mariprofundus ferrinatatus]ATX81140.1 protein of unknown function (DUF1905) [Mariprofundus ferrinatatus]
MDRLHYRITAALWLYQGKAAWHFLTLPKAESDEIRFFSRDKRSAWGSLRVTATIGDTTWNTSLFPDSKLGAYVLPVKAEVRRRENIGAGDMVTVALEIAV